MTPKTVRLPQELWDMLAWYAMEDQRSLNGQVYHVLHSYAIGRGTGRVYEAEAPKAPRPPKPDIKADMAAQLPLPFEPEA